MALGQDSVQKKLEPAKCTLSSIILDNKILNHTSARLDHRLYLKFLSDFIDRVRFFLDNVERPAT